jgi:hypothetical protein
MSNSVDWDLDNVIKSHELKPMSSTNGKGKRSGAEIGHVPRRTIGPRWTLVNRPRHPPHAHPNLDLTRPDPDRQSNPFSSRRRSPRAEAATATTRAAIRGERRQRRHGATRPRRQRLLSSCKVRFRSLLSPPPWWFSSRLPPEFGRGTAAPPAAPLLPVVQLSSLLPREVGRSPVPPLSSPWLLRSRVSLLIF